MNELDEPEISPITAQLAKELGFNIPQPKGYFKHGSDEDFVKLLLWCDGESNSPDFGYAPMQSILQRWLRKNFDIHIEMRVLGGKYYGILKGIKKAIPRYEIIGEEREFEEVLEECLTKSLQYLLNKKNKNKK